MFYLQLKNIFKKCKKLCLEIRWQNLLCENKFFYVLQSKNMFSFYLIVMRYFKMEVILQFDTKLKLVYPHFKVHES